jgi:hypothetical protein
MFMCPECGASQPVPGQCAADRWPLAPAGDDGLLGTVIGAYRVARLLGVGGIGPGLPAPENAKPAQWFGNATGAFSASFPDACP